MEPHISNGLWRISTAKELWDVVAQTYSQQNNVARVYQLHRQVAKFYQGDRSVCDYFAALRAIWDEIDSLDPISAHCAQDAEEQKQRLDKRRVFEFLGGLRDEYETTPLVPRSSISHPFPTSQLPMLSFSVRKRGEHPWVLFRRGLLLWLTRPIILRLVVVEGAVLIESREGPHRTLYSNNHNGQNYATRSLLHERGLRPLR